MNERLYLTTDDSAVVEPIEELSRVSLLKDCLAEGGTLPAGSIGTIVMVLGSGEAYSIEFEEPFHALIDVDCDGVKPVSGESRANLAASLDSANRPS